MRSRILGGTTNELKALLPLNLINLPKGQHFYVKSLVQSSNKPSFKFSVILSSGMTIPSPYIKLSL